MPDVRDVAQTLLTSDVKREGKGLIEIRIISSRTAILNYRNGHDLTVKHCITGVVIISCIRVAKARDGSVMP